MKLSEETINAIKQRLSYLEDNQYRCKLRDGGTGRYEQVIKDHQIEIDKLKKDLQTISEEK